MRKNRSPWLHQLDPERAFQTLTSDIETDVAIVGGGIAGISTAFRLLETTDTKVVVLEGYKLAHGATGHNAGQIVAHFERGLSSIVEEFGLELAAKGQRDVENAWDVLTAMYTTAKLDIPFFKFLGRTGFTGKEQTLVRLENNRLRKEGGLEVESIMIDKDATFVSSIPKQYDGLYTLVPQSEIQKVLETERTDFVSVLSYPKGVVNSALFCQEVVRYLLKTYPTRFSLYEHTQVNKVILRRDHALLDCIEHTVKTGRVVLCTNGFENFHILNESGLDIDTRYHHLLSGTTGYMSGYLETQNKDPIAISYFTDPSTERNVAYYYLTRRPYEYEKNQKHNLISIGGPEISLEDTTAYSRDADYPEEYAAEIDAFIKSTYDLDPNKKIEFVFTWHGLMGYTKNGIRMVGPEPKNPVLLYNLGCNGIGILPSVHGATKIARHIRGEVVEKSIFDIPVQAVQPVPDNRDYLAAFLEWFGSRR